MFIVISAVLIMIISPTTVINVAVVLFRYPQIPSLSHRAACPLVAFPSLLLSTRKSSSKLCYLIWAFCAMYAVSRDLVGRLCKHSVTGSTHVYLLKHQSHTEAVKDTRNRLTAQHSTMGTDLWHRFQMQSELSKPNRKKKKKWTAQCILVESVTSEKVQMKVCSKDK